MNSAQALFELLNKWRGELNGNKTQTVARRLHSGDGTPDLLQAIHLLSAVLSEIDRLKELGVDVEMYERYSSNWAKMIIAYPQGWGTNVRSEDAFPQTVLDHLKGLGMLIERNSFSYDSDLIELVLAQLDEILDLLDEDPSIDDVLREYTRELVNLIRRAVQIPNGAGLDFDFPAAIRQLWVALQAAAQKSEAHSETWVQKAKDWVADTKSDVAKATLTALAVGTAKMITGIQ